MTIPINTPSDFNYYSEQFADLRLLRFKIQEFDSLPLERKKYIYYLSQAALAGRDILFDQHHRHNLIVRMVLEEMVRQIRSSNHDGIVDARLLVYLKRVWFSSGIHHHYSTEKMKPDFSQDEFVTWFNQCNWLCIFSTDKAHKALHLITELLFNPQLDTKRVWNAPGDDVVQMSCNNFYEGVTQDEAIAFYGHQKQQAGDQCPSFGLNSKLIKTDGVIKEEIWHLHGKYGKAIQAITQWLKLAQQSAENDKQVKTIDLLIQYYTTGNLHLFDQYNIEWLNDNLSQTDFINGFIEVYADPLGIKGTWEALVNITDEEETRKASIISQHAPWFEKHSPVDAAFKKQTIQGVSMKIINAVMLGGDCYPASPLGINLPNADWIREKHGSKSVSLANISQAHHYASLKAGVIEEFAANDEEVEIHRQYGADAEQLHTHLHECLGHGSGRMLPGVTSEMLQSYASVIEETRADLFALYYICDLKMIELKLITHYNHSRAQYNSYIRNGLMVQLTRIEPGKQIEQAHMRCRQLICKWVFEKAAPHGAIEKIKLRGKTYFQIINYGFVRQLFGKLLHEVQRIKSEGDYEAAKQLVETYGVQVDQELHQEVLARYAKLNLAPFTGFINPQLTPIDINGHITDVKVNYNETFEEQMFRYSRDFGFLTQDAIKSI
ncbi:MAG: dihydrofolate reductase [Marinilabiliaceae bacterium]|nr:dihydrofolate reductase [Marinilabiliaceae bacterium]